MTPLDPTVAAGAAAYEAMVADADREALRERLVAAKGNVSQVARDLVGAGATPRDVRSKRQAVTRAIDRLRLRAWLAEAFPRADRFAV